MKVDIDLIRGIDQDRAKRSIVAHCLRMFEDLGVRPVCEGVETLGEYDALTDLGVRLMQGFFFARPAFERPSEPAWPGATAA